MDQERLFYLTQEGFERIKKEYNTLKNLKSAKFKGTVPQIFESGDINSEYLVFREDSNLLEVKLAELENILKHAQLIKSPEKNKDIISFGAEVLVEINNRYKEKFKIVGTSEANPVLGKISNESPVGKALWGRKLGDEIVVYFPIRTFYKIKKINY
jgi:transcription elongation factor GreA